MAGLDIINRPCCSVAIIAGADQCWYCGQWVKCTACGGTLLPGTALCDSCDMGSLTQPAELPYAPLRRRVAANLIDCAVLLAVGALLYFDLRVLYPPLVTLTVGVLYFSILESSQWQGTLGGHLMGLVVVGVRGNRVSFRRALVRSVGMVLSANLLGLGYLVAFFNPRRQTLHDRLAGTIVLKAHDL